MYLSFIYLFFSVSIPQNAVFVGATQSSVEATIKKWLQYASDRNGGRTERLKRKMAES